MSLACLSYNDPLSNSRDVTSLFSKDKLINCHFSCVFLRKKWAEMGNFRFEHSKEFPTNEVSNTMTLFRVDKATLSQALGEESQESEQICNLLFFPEKTADSSLLVIYHGNLRGHPPQEIRP